MNEVSKSMKAAAAQKALEKLLKLRDEGNYNSCLCPILKKSLQEVYEPRITWFINAQIQQIFELGKYKPRRRYDAFYDIWFPRTKEGLSQRIKIARAVYNKFKK